jgi:aarF domain-containing kinase
MRWKPAAIQVADYETMARALATIGACDVDVDFTAFSRDLEAFFAELEQVSPVVVAGGERTGMTWPSRSNL